MNTRGLPPPIVSERAAHYFWYHFRRGLLFPHCGRCGHPWPCRPWRWARDIRDGRWDGVPWPA